MLCETPVQRAGGGAADCAARRADRADRGEAAGRWGLFLVSELHFQFERQLKDKTFKYSSGMHKTRTQTRGKLEAMSQWPTQHVGYDL